MKKRRNHRSTERNPKLHVLGYENNIIECEMENRPKTIKFKFDPNNVNPVEVAQDLVKQDLLSDSQTTIFIEMVRDIQRQLKENPNQLPIASQCCRRSMEKRDETSTTAANFTHIFDPTIIDRQALATGLSSTTTSSTSSSPLSQHQVISSLISSQTNDVGNSTENSEVKEENNTDKAPTSVIQDEEVIKSATDLRNDNQQATITNVCTVTDEIVNDNNSSCDENSRKASTVSTDYTSHENTPENTITSASNLNILNPTSSFGEQDTVNTMPIISDEYQLTTQLVKKEEYFAAQVLDTNTIMANQNECSQESISTSVPLHITTASDPVDGALLSTAINNFTVMESSSQNMYQQMESNINNAEGCNKNKIVHGVEDMEMLPTDETKAESPPNEPNKTPMATPHLKELELAGDEQQTSSLLTVVDSGTGIASVTEIDTKSVEEIENTLTDPLQQQMSSLNNQQQHSLLEYASPSTPIQHPLTMESADKLVSNHYNEGLQNQQDIFVQQQLPDMANHQTQQSFTVLSISDISEATAVQQQQQQLQQQMQYQIQQQQLQQLSFQQQQLQQQQHQLLLQQQQLIQQNQQIKPTEQVGLISGQVSADPASREPMSNSNRMPETLEQLKIGLENITHVHVNTNKSSGSTGLSSQASATALSAMVSPHPVPYPLPTETGLSQQLQQQQHPQVMFYQSQDFVISDSNASAFEEANDPATNTVVPSKAQEYIVEGTTYAAVVAGEFVSQSAQHIITMQDQSSTVESLEQSQQYASRRLQLQLSQLIVGAESPKATEQQTLTPQINSVVTSPSVEPSSALKMPNDAKPLIRKVSRFQVQTVQESPLSVELQSQTTAAQHNPVSAAMSVDIQTNAAFSSPTDEKSCQTFPTQYQQQTAMIICEVPTTNELEAKLNLVLPKTPNVETTSSNFSNICAQGSAQQASNTTPLQLSQDASCSNVVPLQEQMAQQQLPIHQL
uniref:Serine/threonine-protein kinase WNK CCTL2 domain-containing protein n=1 Tax=Anopheles christyi TaxID=43041 RepID=A0A182JT76_9DIPT